MYVPKHFALDDPEKIAEVLRSYNFAHLISALDGQAPVGSIANTGTRGDGASEWQVRTQECDLTVYLIPVLPEGPGKTSYRLDIPGRCE